MKEININFVKDETLDGIDVTVRASEKDSEVLALIDRINTPGSETISVVSGNIANVVPVNDIVLLSVENKNVNVITDKDRFTARQPLNSIEAALDPKRFVRISRYEIVNLAKVVRYDFTLSGTLRIELAGGMETWASRRCIPEIRRCLSGKE
ncbi:MAG: LytTR family transcriptional regulator DNA-binding domain-containing protein [Ruminiclostridium sp.]|nr:LytTR family transcriptional regulator DNA-binding domain-containing protein [Ruminiclostridium sp.]